MTLPEVELATSDHGILTDRFDKLLRVSNESTNDSASDGDSQGELGDDELDPPAHSTARALSSPRSMQKSAGNEVTGVTTVQSGNADLETSNPFTSAVELASGEYAGIATEQESESQSMSWTENTECKEISIKDFQYTQSRGTAVQDSDDAQCKEILMWPENPESVEAAAEDSDDAQFKETVMWPEDPELLEPAAEDSDDAQYKETVMWPEDPEPIKSMIEGSDEARRVVWAEDTDCIGIAVTDFGPTAVSQDLVERDWEADYVATRGPYDTTRSVKLQFLNSSYCLAAGASLMNDRLSYRKRLSNFVFTVGGKTVPLKQPIINAVVFGIALRILRDILIAVGVQNGWLRSIQNAQISKESTLEMRRALETHFRKPRTGQFDKSTFCQIVRVVSWVLGEIRDDLHALVSSSHARDDLRGHLYRVRFAKDWSIHFPPMLKGYQIVLNGKTKPSVVVNDPLNAVSHALLQARPLSGKKSRRKRQKSGEDAMGEGAAENGLTTALANFWFGGLHVHSTLRKVREQHTVSSGQPSPYTVQKLQKLPKILRWQLRARCLDVNHAIIKNIELIQAEIRASLGEDADPSLPQSHKSLEERLELKKSQVALTHLQSMQQGLQQDLQDIQDLFVDDQIANRDVDILLFYSSLRTHAWNNRWYGITGEFLVEELDWRPDAVMRQAYNVGRTTQNGESATG